MTKHHHVVYVGRYTTLDTSGIYAFIFDTATGTLTAKGSFGTIQNPSFIIVHPNRCWLYTVSELSQSVDGKSGRVWALALNENDETNPFHLLNDQASGGDLPCHLAIDADGRWLVVSNYASGTVAVFAIQSDGRLGTMVDLIQQHGSGPYVGRQDSSHTHSTIFTPDNRFLIVADLGIDQIVIYAFDPVSGTLKAHSQIHTRPGSGPRHMAFHPQNQLFVASCELDNTVVAYDYDSEKGQLEERQVIVTLPPKVSGSTVADIHFDSHGTRLYVSNRGHNSIATFAVLPDRQLKRLAIEPSGGEWPRHFAIAPDGRFLLVANQYSGEVTVLPVLDSTNILGEPVARVAVPGASCVQIVI